jgi:hypothetical protein
MNIHNALIIHFNAYSPALEKNTIKLHLVWFEVSCALSA